MDSLPRISESRLLLAHVNVQSLLASTHLTDFKELFREFPCNIICISESWLSPDIPDDMVGLDDYVIFRNDRIGRMGGGVAMYVHRSFKSRIVASSERQYSGKPEYLFVEVNSQSHPKILIAVVYRPPKAGYLSEFIEECTRLHSSYNNLIIMGDFNIDLIRDSHDKQFLLQFIDINDYFLIPFDPTHHTANSETIIDHCILDRQEKLIDHGQIHAPISWHDCIWLQYDAHADCIFTKEILSRNFRSFNSESFLSELGSTDWHPFYSSHTVDDMLEFLTTTVTNMFDKHAPLRKIVRNRRPAPWLTDDVRAAMRNRNKAKKVHSQLGTAESRENFRRSRNQAKLLIRDSKRKYFGEAFKNIKNAKEGWDRMRHLGLLRSTVNNSDLVVPPQDLNNYFASICSAESDNTVFQATGFDDSLLYFKDISPEMLCQAISAVTSNAVGADGLSIKLIKIALPVIFPLILHLFNFSLNSGTFPSKWKLALIKPIAKIKAPQKSSDYRPISLLCALSKLLEWLVSKQLKTFLEKNELLDPYQSAYRDDYSTQTALLGITDNIRAGIDRRMLTIMVLFDFSKAFDKVNHGILLRKLKNLGMSDCVVEWMRSYLTDRHQATLGNIGELSDWAPVTSGVPQGSVLGPLLFIIYISDFKYAIADCCYNFYADDLQIFISCNINNIEDAIRRINKDILLLRIWARLNGLELNIDKTDAIIFGSRAYVSSLDLNSMPAIMNGSVVVKYSDAVRILGFSLSNSLDWRDQAIKTAKSVNSKLYQLKTCRSFLSTDTRIKLVSSLIFPVIDYCCVVLNGITDEQNNLIQVALNSCVRFIYNANKFEHITQYFTRLKWLKVKPRRIYMMLTSLFNVLNSGRPQNLRNSFEINNILTTTARRQQPFLRIRTFRTETYRNSFCISVAYHANRLTTNAFNLSKNEFKTLAWNYANDSSP